MRKIVGCLGRILTNNNCFVISVASAEFVAGGVFLRFDDSASVEFSEIVVDVSEELPTPETEGVTEIGDKVEGEGEGNTSDTCC